MSHGTDATVECPVCGGAFDPSVSGGWCTDSECGASRVTRAASGGRRLTHSVRHPSPASHGSAGHLLVTDGGPTEDARAENGDDEDETDAGSYLVDLGESATVVNDEELEQGDRVPVESGGWIDRSGVARIDVRQG